MKTLRLWLLELLRMLLPIRVAAVAAVAAMLCPPVGSAGQRYSPELADQPPKF